MRERGRRENEDRGDKGRDVGSNSVSACSNRGAHTGSGWAGASCVVGHTHLLSLESCRSLVWAF